MKSAQSQNIFFRNTFRISLRQTRGKVNLPLSSSLTQKINKFTVPHSASVLFSSSHHSRIHLLKTVDKYIILDFFDYKYLKYITYIICHKCCYWSPNFMVLWSFSCWSKQQKQESVEKAIKMIMADSPEYTHTILSN